MDPKPKPNDEMYGAVLDRMTPAERLEKAFELSEMSKELFRAGLRHQFPNLSDEEFHKLYLDRLAECHNKNY